MTRPGDRPLYRLPTLATRKATLEKCVFCPKLCRSACPVSNAEPRETLTPWGKMSMAYFVANGSVPVARSFAAPAWACTGCFGCRESCDHRNDVTGTLFAARSALVASGVAPEGATRTLARFAETSAALGNTARELSALDEVKADAPTAVLVGCAYARKAPDVARDAVRAIAKLSGGPVTVLETCCGAPLSYAGDEARFRAQGEALVRAVGDRELVVVDAGCASTIRVHHAEAGRVMPKRALTFVEVALRELGSLGRADVTRLGIDGGPVRFHDPCQLGRGLGLYEAPRAVLTRALGRAPEEFERRREDARCSGAGGLLPVTMPEVSRAIARGRKEDHERSGGGTIVTACASSRRAFEKEGAKAMDLVTIVADALGLHR